MAIPSKADLKAFEARLDGALARRQLSYCDASKALRFGLNLDESSAAQRAHWGSGGVFSDAIETFAPHLVSGTTGPEIELEELASDFEFGCHYHHLREVLYYSYNAPGSFDWVITDDRVDIRYADRSLPIQFFTVWNEYVLGSIRLFEGFDGSDRLKSLLEGRPEFDPGEGQTEIEALLGDYADLKLGAYFSILDASADIDLGGYSYREAYAVNRVLLMKALYHRYHAVANGHLGFVHIDSSDMIEMLTEDAHVRKACAERIIADLVYDQKAVADRVDPSYFSLFRDGTAPHQILLRPFHFSMAEGLVNLLRVVAQRRPQAFLANVSNPLGAAFVQRLKTAFEAQGFTCRAEISLQAIDPTLPDIDLLVIAEEPTLGFVMLVCEVKSPLPPRWAKDQLRALAKDGVSKAFRQVEAIRVFLGKAEGLEFIRSVVPEGGLEHFDSFVTVLQQLIITSDNAGMFFSDEKTPIVNFRTMERLLQRSDGDILHIRRCIETYNEGADERATTVTQSLMLDGMTVSYEGFAPSSLMDFPQAEWNSSPERQQMIDDFVAGGHHPFDCLAERDGIAVGLLGDRELED